MEKPYYYYCFLHGYTETLRSNCQGINPLEIRAERTIYISARIGVRKK